MISRTQAVLSGKAVVDTARGMLAATAGITPHEAARYLHAYAAHHHHHRPTSVADRLVRRALTPEEVLHEASSPGPETTPAP
ncbi:ANTAR domain-containing protein [Streptomyces sp. A0592]|uniref:ANTAR domain-containing protein n=1 Tax=Streptomyces sp. A0592 TaxID=2563099 RepID=UPI0014461CB2|nr:ANTAR domain-containing protein [Streptomyces sp. A0592]